MPRLCEDWLKTYLQYTQYLEAPTQFHFWSGVSAIAGALQRRVWIEQNYFQWTPNFYIFLIAPPGVVQKSTSAGIAMRLLRELSDIHFGPSSVTWQALTEAMENATTSVVFSDGTTTPMSCLTIEASELGTFLAPDDREFIDVLVDLWDSKKTTWERKTKTQGHTAIKNPWINIIGSATDAWFRENVPEYMIGGGFTSRAIFIRAEKKRHLTAYPGLVIPEAEISFLHEQLLHDLQQISQMKGEFKLSAEAIIWGERWYKDHWEKPRPEKLQGDRYGGYWSRKQTHVHKLAIILAAAQSDNLVIELDHLKQAESFITSLEPSMCHIFSMIGSADKSQYINEIIGVLRVCKKIKKQALWRYMINRIGDAEEFSRALRGAVMAGYVGEANHEGELWVFYKEDKSDEDG